MPFLLNLKEKTNMDIIFKDRNEVLELIRCADHFTETNCLILHFQKQKKERQEFYLTLEELNCILKWKLKQQINRQQVKREFSNSQKIKCPIIFLGKKYNSIRASRHVF